MRGVDSQRGTTLIEILASVLILSVGLLVLVGLHARTLQTSVDAENRSNAALLTNELATAMWITHDSTNNATVQAAFLNWQSVPLRALPSTTDYSPQYSIGPADANGSVLVTVSWQAPGQQSAGNAVTSKFFTTVTVP